MGQTCFTWMTCTAVVASCAKASSYAVSSPVKVFEGLEGDDHFCVAAFPPTASFHPFARSTFCFLSGESISKEFSSSSTGLALLYGISLERSGRHACRSLIANLGAGAAGPATDSKATSVRSITLLPEPAPAGGTCVPARNAHLGADEDGIIPSFPLLLSW